MKKEFIKYFKYISIIVLLVIFDQVSKFFALKYLVNSDIAIIKNFFSLSFIKNTGAAFGLMSGNIILLILLSLFLIWYLIKELRKNNTNKYNVISLVMIIGGSFGNLIDRVARGYVIDFFSFRIFNKDMPIFNIADILITLGVIILIIVIIVEERNANKNK